MIQYIDKSSLVAKIMNRIKELQNLHKENEEKLDSIQKTAILLCIDECKVILSFLDALEVKEVDLKLIIGWFDHIAQIADDRMTLTNQRMTDAHALDEIKCLAKDSSKFIAQHYKAQKGEKV